MAITIWFQNLFTPQQGFFSAFPHGTKYAIGLEMYLGLGVDATQIQTQYPMHPTQEYYGAAIPSRLQLSKRGLKIYLKHHISTYLTVRDSVCPTSSSLAVTNDIAIAFSSSTY